jgi:hypothetical protein
MLLAQTIDSLPASFWKNFSLALFALIIVGGIVVGIYVSLRKPEPRRLNDDPPIEIRKAPKRYNHDLTEIRFTEIERRITKHDEELTEIQNSRLHALNHINRRFERVLIGLANIAGKVGTKIPDEQNEGEES